MKKSYLFLIILGILLTVFANIASFRSLQKLLSFIAERQSTYTQKENLLRLYSEITDAETGQRGYIITGRNDYLEPYNAALKTIFGRLSIIEEELVQSNQQDPLFQELTRLIQLKLDELSNRIEVRRQKGFELAQKIVVSSEGKRLMDNIHLVLNQMLSNKTQTLSQQDKEIQDLAKQTVGLNIGAALLTNFLILLYSFLFYRDTLKMKKISTQLTQTYELYKAILTSAKQIIITTDTEGLILSFNKGAEKSLGYEAEETIGKKSILNFYDRKFLQKEKGLNEKLEGDFPIENFTSLVASSRYLVWTESEWIMKRKNETLFPCSQTITALRDDLNQVKGYLFIGSDVSDYKKWERDLQSAREIIEEAQLSKNRFLASFSRDLRVHLNAIMNFSTLLLKNKSGNLKEQETSYVTQIADNCKSILHLINEVMVLSKQAAGLLKPNFTPLALFPFLRQLVNEMDQTNIKLTLDVAKDIKYLETDEIKLHDLLTNLIRFISKQMRQGQLLIRVLFDGMTQQPLAIEITQKKSEQKITYISTEEQENFSPTKNQEEWGVAQSLATMLGYNIQVLNRLGKGSVYILSFKPISSLNSRSQVSSEFSSRSQERGDTLFLEQKPLNVLVLDDDVEFRHKLTNYLQSSGVHVLDAATGEEALRLARENAIDLITMDMLMSPMNGYEVVQRLKSDPLLKKIPFVFIGIIAKEIQKKIPEALAFFNKPMNEEDLAKLLNLLHSSL